MSSTLIDSIKKTKVSEAKEFAFLASNLNYMGCCNQNKPDLSFLTSSNNKIWTIKNDINALKNRLKHKFLFLRDASSSREPDIQNLINIVNEIIKETLKDLLKAQ